MGTFGTFLLAVAAFVGTILLVVDPTAKLTNWMRGKKKSQMERELKEWTEAQEVGSLISKGCGFVVFLLTSLAFTFMVEPLAVIAALVNKIGYQPLAYVMLAIVALSWVEAVRGFRSGLHKNKHTGAVVTPDGENMLRER